MKEREVHSIILEKTEETEDDELRNFINDILRFERSKLDRDNNPYSDKYKELIDEYALESEEGESTES